MSVDTDFETIKILIASSASTRGLDAFLLSTTKAEKQIRKVFSYLVFQNDYFTPSNSKEIKEEINSHKNLYFDHFEKGIKLLIGKNIEDLLHQEYEEFKAHKLKIKPIRNKLIHGQLTLEKYTTEQLIEASDNIKKWCKKLDEKFNEEIGFGGFERNSFQKSQVDVRLIRNINNRDDLRKIIKDILKNNTKNGTKNEHI